MGRNPVIDVEAVYGCGKGNAVATILHGIRKVRGPLRAGIDAAPDASTPLLL